MSALPAFYRERKKNAPARSDPAGADPIATHLGQTYRTFERTRIAARRSGQALEKADRRNMAELPILPLKTDALLADTTHMSAEEFGAYCRILFVMWRHGGKLKVDDVELSTICGLSVRRYRKIKEKLLRPLTIIDGFASQKNLTATRLDVLEIRQKRALAANARWCGKGHAHALQMHSKCNANQNQIKENLPSTVRESVAEPAEKGLGKVKIGSPELAAVLAKKP